MYIAHTDIYDKRTEESKEDNEDKIFIFLSLSHVLFIAIQRHEWNETVWIGLVWFGMVWVGVWWPVVFGFISFQFLYLVKNRT